MTDDHFVEGARLVASDRLVWAIAQEEGRGVCTGTNKDRNTKGDME